MIFSAKRQPENVYEWLLIATKELDASAQKRVWSEILAHYMESVAANQAEGLTESVACERALAELGDAHKAAKNFYLSHLNEAEAKRLHRLLDRSRKLSFRAASVCWFIMLVIATVILSKIPALHITVFCDLAIAFLAMVLFLIGSYYASANQKTRDALLLLKFAKSLGGLAVVYLMGAFLSDLLHLHGAFVCVISLGFLFDLWRITRLVRKIPHDWPSPIQS